MKMRARRSLSLCLVITFTLPHGAVAGARTGEATGAGMSAAAPAVHYVALGDSYSSGTGAGAYGDSGDCQRSANAYPRLWADSHEVAGFAFVACAGATTSDVLNQADTLDTSTTLITVSVGGNDADFVEVMLECTLSTDQHCVDRVEQAKAAVHSTLPERLDAVYTTLSGRAPHAEVIVFGYPRIYELNGSCQAGLSETKRAAINSGVDALAEVTAQRAAAAGFTFVDIREPFTGHEICSDDWWLHSWTWPPGESYHPTARGHSLGYLPALEVVVSTDRPAEQVNH